MNDEILIDDCAGQEVPVSDEEPECAGVPELSDGEDAAAEIQEPSVEEPSKSADIDMEALLAEAEERGYLRGLNERAENLMNRPSVGYSPTASQSGVRTAEDEVMILNNIRPSIWDV